MRDSIENISQLQKKLNDLQLENQILKNILDKAGLSYHKELSKLRQSGSKEAFDPEQGKRIIHPQAITENMANQFFSMFWGRQDVYAKRSVNKETGKAAYYPQCNNFWTNVCHKKIKDGINCKNCKNRSYKTITKKDILNHLQGNAYNASDVIGVYPLLSNGTCRFMVFDFDNHDKDAEEKDFANSDDTWVEEVESMREICVLNGIEPLVERSRSGRGAHVWIFFDKPIAASFVRKFGFALLDKGAEIQRNELAGNLGCVPSQINYVITSRFTPEQGYIVESRRGGGGYIRISRVSMDRGTAIMHIINSVGNSLDKASAEAMLNNMVNRSIIKLSVAKVMASALSDRALHTVEQEKRDSLRADLFKNMLLAIS